MTATSRRTPLPRAAWGGALAALLATSTLSATAAPAVAAEASAAAPDSVTGTHVVLVASPEPGAKSTQETEVHFVETDDGERVELVGDADLLDAETSGDQITATGDFSDAPDGDGTQLEVTEIAVDEPASAAAETAVTGAKKTAVILLKEGASGVAGTSVEAQRSTYFTRDGSVSDHLAEMSWNQVSLVGRDDPAGGDVYDYLVIPEGTACFNEDYYGALAAADAGIDLSTYDYVSFVIDSSATAGCRYGGYAPLGGDRNLIVDYGPTYDRRGTIIHELGHNFGLHHSGALTCKDAGGARVSLLKDGSGCTRKEYGDPFDLMGTSLPPYSAGNKALLGWIPQANVLTVASDGVYDLAPNGLQGDHTQALTIPRPGSLGPLVVDFRQPLGVYGEANVSRFPSLLDGVTVRLGSQLGVQNALVDTTPETESFTDAPLTVGRTLYDPVSGVTLETVEVTATRARVRVTFPPALDQVYLRGTHNAWGLTTPMTRNGGDHLWRADVRFGDGPDERFKFDVEGDWTHNYGDSDGDGIAERSGGDIHVTDGPGNYTVTFDDLTGAYSVTRKPSPPVIVTQDAITAVVGEPVTLDASASHDPDGDTVVSYEWGCCQMRYGQWDTFEIDEPTATHTFQRVGTYEPMITVVDDQGDSAQKRVTVTVVAGEENLPPVADAGSDVTLTAGDSHTFGAWGSYDGDGEIASYAWAGLGQTGTDRSWTATFPDPGSYPVTLTVTDDDGASSTATVTVTVEPADELVSTYPQMLLRGTHNAWGTDVAMEFVAENTWRATVEFGGGADERLKFDVDGTWATNFGDNEGDGVAEAGGKDIPVLDGAGLYTVTFDDSTHAYTVVKS